ncbi:CBS domain-containing protein [Candidatus Woesearchaeota archaeon]|nr:CBS domain-containing protein [Candidatus Woesearchaeota archaeon]
MVGGKNMKTGLKVIDAMTQEIISVDPDTSVKRCAEIMKKHHVGSVIVKENNNLLGIISEQDLVYKVIAKDKDTNEILAKDIMTDEPVTISPGKDIYDALVRMRDKNVRRLPVLDNGELIGFLTSKDVLKIEPQLFEILVDKIQLREEAKKPISTTEITEGLCEECGEYTEYLYEQDNTFLCENCKI